jgi:hypothetical protein
MRKSANAFQCRPQTISNIHYAVCFFVDCLQNNPYFRFQLKYLGAFLLRRFPSAKIRYPGWQDGFQCSLVFFEPEWCGKIGNRPLF